MAIAAILVCWKYPAAVRIRPSTGDGGTDLLVPAVGGDSNVYQVKTLASNLSASSKFQIEDSLRQLDQHRVAQSLAVSDLILTFCWGDPDSGLSKASTSSSLAEPSTNPAAPTYSGPHQLTHARSPQAVRADCHT